MTRYIFQQLLIVRSTLKQSELLYIGDCKMSSIGTRSHIGSGGDFYLCPLNAKQASPEQLVEYLQPIWDGKQELTTIDYDYADGETKNIAEGFERRIIQKIEVEEQEISWEERQLVVHLFAFASSEERHLNSRIQKTSDALEELKKPRRGKKKLTSSEEWESAVAAILKRYRTSGLFQIDIQTKHVQTAKRRYLERQSQTVELVSFNLDFKINEDAVAREVQLLGWRVYVTNKTEAQLSLKQAVRAYRDDNYKNEDLLGLRAFLYL